MVFGLLQPAATEEPIDQESDRNSDGKFITIPFLSNVMFL